MGHKRTIRPNAKKLSALFMARERMAWDTFAKKVKWHQRGFMGEPDDMRPGRGEFHEFPYACICEKPYSVNESNRTLEEVRKPEMEWKSNAQNQGDKTLERVKLLE